MGFLFRHLTKSGLDITGWKRTCFTELLARSNIYGIWKRVETSALETSLCSGFEPQSPHNTHTSVSLFMAPGTFSFQRPTMLPSLSMASMLRPALFSNTECCNRNVQYSHVWLWSTWTVANVTKELNWISFKCEESHMASGYCTRWCWTIQVPWEHTEPKYSFLP